MLLVKRGGVISLTVLLLLSRIGSVLVHAMLVLVLPFSAALGWWEMVIGTYFTWYFILGRFLLCFVTETFNVKQGSLK